MGVDSVDAEVSDPLGDSRDPHEASSTAAVEVAAEGVPPCGEDSPTRGTIKDIIKVSTSIVEVGTVLQLGPDRRVVAEVPEAVPDSEVAAVPHVAVEAASAVAAVHAVPPEDADEEDHTDNLYSFQNSRWGFLKKICPVYFFDRFCKSICIDQYDYYLEFYSTD